MMKKSRARRSRKQQPSSSSRSYASRRELNEDLHRYNACIVEQPDLFLMEEDSEQPIKKPREEEGRTNRLTRSQRKEVNQRRFFHLLQFIFLFFILLALLTWVLHASVLYLF